MKGAAEADGTRAAQQDFLLYRVQHMAVGEAHVSAVDAQVGEDEFVVPEFHIGMLARGKIVGHDDLAGVAASDGCALVFAVDAEFLAAVGQDQFRGLLSGTDPDGHTDAGDILVILLPDHLEDVLSLLLSLDGGATDLPGA